MVMRLGVMEFADRDQIVRGVRATLGSEDLVMDMDPSGAGEVESEVHPVGHASLISIEDFLRGRRRDPWLAFPGARRRPTPATERRLPWERA